MDTEINKRCQRY